MDERINCEDTYSVIGDFIADEKVNVQKTVAISDQVARLLTTILNQASSSECLMYLLYISGITLKDISVMLQTKIYIVKKVIHKWLRRLPYLTNMYDLEGPKFWFVETNGFDYIIKVRNNK